MVKTLCTIVIGITEADEPGDVSVYDGVPDSGEVHVSLPASPQTQTVLALHPRPGHPAPPPLPPPHQPQLHPLHLPQPQQHQQHFPAGEQ